MANTIDSGQPLKNPLPKDPVSSPQELQPTCIVEKEPGPLGAEGQSYLQQAKQDVEDIRQLGANSDDPEACLDAFEKSASKETGTALARVVERLCSIYEGEGNRNADRRIEPMLRKTGQRIQGIIQRYSMSEGAHGMLARPLRRINKALDFNGIPPFEVPPRIDPLTSQRRPLPEPEDGPPPQGKRP